MVEPGAGTGCRCVGVDSGRASHLVYAGVPAGGHHNCLPAGVPKGRATRCSDSLQYRLAGSSRGGAAARHDAPSSVSWLDVQMVVASSGPRNPLFRRHCGGTCRSALVVLDGPAGRDDTEIDERTSRRFHGIGDSRAGERLWDGLVVYRRQRLWMDGPMDESRFLASL